LIGIQNLRKGVAEIVAVRIGGVAELLNLLEFGVALRNQVRFLIRIQDSLPR